MENQDQIRSIFMESFRKKVCFAVQNPADWDSVLDKSGYIPVEYTVSSLTYQYTYVKCFFEKVLDLSVIVYERNRPVCIWPLTLLFHEGNYWFATNEKEILPPFFTEEIQLKERKNIITDCLKALERVHDFLAVNNTVKALQTKCRLPGNTEQWFRKCMENGAQADLICELYTDLGLELDDIHRQIRKCYHSLINKAAVLWNAEVLTSVSVEQFELFHRKHIEVAGRVTRSQETWDLQREMINSGHAFLVMLTDQNNGFVGGGLFEYSRDESLYSVGVYDRELFDRPVSHLVQWTAIRHMKELGLKRYKIGQRFYPGKTGNLREPTEKELSISYFKEGFATDFLTSIILTNQWK